MLPVEIMPLPSQQEPAPLEITFAPTRLNIHEAEDVIERARSLGAFRFNTGRLMRIGTAARMLSQSTRSNRRRLPLFKKSSP